jgi:hypothetical protein
MCADSFRVQYDSTGKEVDTSLETAMKEEAATPAPAPKQSGAMRGTFNTETGEFRVEENHATGMLVSPSVEKATARNAAGLPISMSNVKPGDVVSLPGLGDSRAEVYESMGLIRRLPGGMGYEVVGQEQQTTPEQQKQEQKPAVEEPGDVRNVPGTSQEVDTFQADLAKRSPAGFDGLLTSLVKTGEMPTNLVDDLARQSGQDSADFTANVERMTSEYVAAGRSALGNVGVTAPEAFEQWARSEQPDAFDNAVRDLVTGKSVARMQDLGRRFVQQSNDRLAALIMGKGVEAEVRDGQVWVKRSDLGLPPTSAKGDFGRNTHSTLRDMIREGHITING